MSSLYYRKHQRNADLRVVETFNRAGLYDLHTPSADAAKILYTPGKDKNAPVCIILEGYRGDGINGANNIKISNIFEEYGFAVAQVNYSRYNHYNGVDTDEYLGRADTATLQTNIENFAAISNLDIKRDNIVFSNSFSINVAIGALRQEKISDNVKHIIAAAPFPNFAQIAVLSQLENKRTDEAIKARSDLNEYGFFLHGPPDSTCQVKFTKQFLDDVKSNSRSYNLFSDELANLEHKPTIDLIYSKNDPVAPASLTDKWAAHMRACGFNFSKPSILKATSHSFTNEFYRSFRPKVRALAKEYGL